MKAVAADLKSFYSATSMEEAESCLIDLETRWDAKYKAVSREWRDKWGNIISLFGYPPEIRKVMYTTNAIESLNMVIRKAIRNRRIFPRDEFTTKLVYLVIRNASKNWTKPIRDWKPAFNYLLIKFGDRLDPQR